MASKVELMAPAATVTVAGTVNSGLSLDNRMAIPPAGAATFSVAEQADAWLALRLPGEHVIEDRTGTARTPPVEFNAGSAEPVAVTPTGFNMPIDAVVALVASVSWMLATIPKPIAFEFDPVSRQVSKPGPGAHDSVFPAAVASGPAVALIADIWLGGTTKVHCNPAGESPLPPKDSARLAVDPGLPIPEDRLRLGFCAHAELWG